MIGPLVKRFRFGHLTLWAIPMESPLQNRPKVTGGVNPLGLRNIYVWVFPKVLRRRFTVSTAQWVKGFIKNSNSKTLKQRKKKKSMKA